MSVIPHLASRLLIGAFAPLAAAVLPGQDPGPQPATSDQVDWRLPFRDPDKAIAPPAEIWPDLQAMYGIATGAGRDQVYYDEHGREKCGHSAWKAAYDRLLGKRLDPGYLSLILRDSGSVADRQLALYAMFYIGQTQLVFQMIEHIPGEPSRRLREEAFPRAIEFCRVHLPTRNGGDLEEWRKMETGPAGQKPPQPGTYSFGFDPVPFYALLERAEAPIDRAQALWFLRTCAEIRPEVAEAFLEAIGKQIPALAHADNAAVAEQARGLLTACDPRKDRDAPSAAATAAEIEDWAESIIEAVLPPIRQIGKGLVDLYPSPQLDAIVASARKRLLAGELGITHSGKTREGNFFRGFRISSTPEPLDQLGLPVDAVLTAINGTPVSDGKSILDVVATHLKAGRRRLVVEYVDAGVARAKQYRLR